MPRGMVSFVPVKPTVQSASGHGFRGAGGERIANYGEQQITFRTKEGQTRKTTWQVADVRRPLMSVSRMSATGHEVVLNGKNPRVINLRTQEVTQLRREGNVVVLDLWVQGPGVRGPPAPRASVAKVWRSKHDHKAAGDAMCIGNMQTGDGNVTPQPSGFPRLVQ